MKQHKLFYGSSYDRGLDILLFMWPDIIAKFPDAELHVCYGWELFDRIQSTNPERMQWKKSIEEMMNQKGVIHHGRVGKDELTKIRQSCGIWAYPTYFPEINCITALDAQNDGLVPVTMNDYALKETVQSGVKIDGNIKDFDVQEKFKEELLSLMDDKPRWEKEVKRAKAFAKKFIWANIAKSWSEYFEQEVDNPTVSVITITNREGFWNVMADNLSRQTVKPLEWIIVDDHEQDRSEIASKYAKKYNLNIVYIRGDKALKTYDKPHAIARANNKGWQSAKGDLLVYVQDFVIIPEDGIESLVDVYRRNPNALIAPTDDYWFSVEPDFNNRQDWFNGKTDIFTTHSWRNVRNEFSGIRDTDNPYDFEMDYAGIPRKIVEHLNGWWELFDENVGFDNTEIAYRALKSGYKIIIDDTNMARCVDLDRYIPHTDGSANEKNFKKIQSLDPIRDEK